VLSPETQRNSFHAVAASFQSSDVGYWKRSQKMLLSVRF